jgi:hypothetical protein
MACFNPDDGTSHAIGDKICHGNVIFECTVNGWTTAGAPCTGAEVATVTTKPATAPKA